VSQLHRLYCLATSNIPDKSLAEPGLSPNLFGLRMSSTVKDVVTRLPDSAIILNELHAGQVQLI